MSENTQTVPNREVIDRLMELGGRFTPLNPPKPAGDGVIPFVLIPSGMKAESLAQFLPPQRIARTVTLLEAGSFADYVNRFKMPETLIFAQVSETGVTFRAFLDYHGQAPDLKPAFCAHVAEFKAIETPDWKTWKAADKKRMNQVDFAEWLEDNSRLLVDPPGADLLELVTSLHGHCNARFNTALRLSNGSYTVSYDEDVVVKGTQTTKGGEIELPPMIKAGISVFQGSPPYEVKARMKSRIEERRLVVYFETVSMAEIVRESILLLVSQISDKTSLVPFLGNT